MKYELMVYFGEGSWVSYITERDNICYAASDFFDTLEKAGINADNINPTEMVFRTMDGDVINTVVW